MHNICFIADVAVFLRISVGLKKPPSHGQAFLLWLVAIINCLRVPDMPVLLR